MTEQSDFPNVVVLAGPNGAGKSTAAPKVLPHLLGIGDFVNADVIAQGLSAFAPENTRWRQADLCSSGLMRLQPLVRILPSRQHSPAGRLRLG